MSSDRLDPGEVRDLLDRTAGRDPDELEARRLEAALVADPRLAAELLDDPALDAAYRATPVAPPSELEWRRVDAAIAKATGRAAGADSGARSAASPRSGWRTLVPLAAAAVLCVLVVRAVLLEDLPSAPPPIVEVDSPDGRCHLVRTLEDGGVMIYISAS